MTRTRISGRACALTVLAGATLLGAPATAAAQLDFVGEFLKSATDIRLLVVRSNFTPRWSSPPYTRPQGSSETGVGIELLFGAGTIPAGNGEPSPTEPDSGGSSLKPTKVTVRQPRSGMPGDSTTEYVPIPAAKDEGGRDLVYLEVGVGYTDAAFVASSSEWEMRGSVRQLPAVSLYATLFPENRVAAYIGLRSGLVQLSGLRAFEPSGELFAGAGQTIQMGSVVGLVAGIWKLNGFIEIETARRRFASVEWSKVIAEGSTLLPTTLPRNLVFKPFTIATGVQLQFKN
jgi:hypothetical protein